MKAPVSVVTAPVLWVDDDVDKYVLDVYTFVIMTTKDVPKKIQRLESRLRLLEKIVGISAAPHSSRSRSKNGLESLYGLWSSKKRTASDLQRIRKRLWRNA